MNATKTKHSTAAWRSGGIDRFTQLVGQARDATVGQLCWISTYSCATTGRLHAAKVAAHIVLGEGVGNARGHSLGDGILQVHHFRHPVPCCPVHPPAVVRTTRTSAYCLPPNACSTSCFHFSSSNKMLHFGPGIPSFTETTHPTAWIFGPIESATASLISSDTRITGACKRVSRKGEGAVGEGGEAHQQDPTASVSRVALDGDTDSSLGRSSAFWIAFRAGICGTGGARWTCGIWISRCGDGASVLGLSRGGDGVPEEEFVDGFPTIWQQHGSCPRCMHSSRVLARADSVSCMRLTAPHQTSFQSPRWTDCLLCFWASFFAMSFKAASLVHE